MFGGRALGSLGEPSYRLYNCARCAAQVRLCRRCDHGNVYCAGECARISRRESVRRAGARYLWRVDLDESARRSGCEIGDRGALSMPVLFVAGKGYVSG